MITRTYYKKKNQAWFMQIDGTTIVHGETPDNAVTLTHPSAAAMAITMNDLIMKKCTAGFAFDRVEQIETETDKKSRTVGGIELAANQFVTDFTDAAALEKTLRRHVDQYHTYTDAVEGKGASYGQVSGGKFVPAKGASGDNELDFFLACAKHAKLLPLMDELVEMISTANYGEKPKMRDKNVPVGSNAAYALALADKKYLKRHTEFCDNLPINRYKARFDTSLPGGGHIPALLKQWKFALADEPALNFLVAQLIHNDNENAKEEIEIILKEHGLAAAMKDKKFLDELYKKFAHRAYCVQNRDDISERDMGMHIFVALGALGITCSKADAMVFGHIMEDIGHYPSMAQLAKGGLDAEEDDFIPFDDIDDDDDDSDDDDDDEEDDSDDDVEDDDDDDDEDEDDDED